MKIQRCLSYMQLCSVFLKFKKNKKQTNKTTSLMPGRLFWEQLLQLKKKTACQNVTILTVLLLVDKWAALV